MSAAAALRGVLGMVVAVFVAHLVFNALLRGSAPSGDLSATQAPRIIYLSPQQHQRMQSSDAHPRVDADGATPLYSTAVGTDELVQRHLRTFHTVHHAASDTASMKSSRSSSSTSGEDVKAPQGVVDDESANVTNHTQLSTNASLKRVAGSIVLLVGAVISAGAVGLFLNMKASSSFSDGDEKGTNMKTPSSPPPSSGGECSAESIGTPLLNASPVGNGPDSTPPSSSRLPSMGDSYLKLATTQLVLRRRPDIGDAAEIEHRSGGVTHWAEDLEMLESQIRQQSNRLRVLSMELEDARSSCSSTQQHRRGTRAVGTDDDDDDSFLITR